VPGCGEVRSGCRQKAENSALQLAPVHANCTGSSVATKANDCGAACAPVVAIAKPRKANPAVNTLKILPRAMIISLSRAGPPDEHATTRIGRRKVRYVNSIRENLR
jgi:hypothetical protein